MRRQIPQTSPWGLGFRVWGLGFRRWDSQLSRAMCQNYWVVTRKGSYTPCLVATSIYPYVSISPLLSFFFLGGGGGLRLSSKQIFLGSRVCHPTSPFRVFRAWGFPPPRICGLPRPSRLLAGTIGGFPANTMFLFRACPAATPNPKPETLNPKPETASTLRTRFRRLTLPGGGGGGNVEAQQKQVTSQANRSYS